MDKNAIKKYAVWARQELIERVSQRAMLYGITETNTGDPQADSVNGRLLSPVEKRQRAALIAKIEREGYEQVMEEVAYTWFNRFAALRFMEVNGYLPSHVRVFTNEAGEFKPQILAETIHLELDGLDRKKVYALEQANRTEELFKYLLIVQCNALNSVLPGMFQHIEDYTELLLPDYLLREGSVIERMVRQNTPDSILEVDWTDQVQIIGWLYQYYNTELNEVVYDGNMSKSRIPKELLPAATTIYTPDWCAHYMVENSLGRLWLEGHPNDALKAEWRYYLDEAEQEPPVQVQLAEIRKSYAALKPEEIRVIDPCMGSGHILCVFFDVLIQIYEDYGYTAREAAAMIVENNLYGLDIDDRAAQLAYFSVMMKARQYDRRFFSRKVQPHVYAIPESSWIEKALPAEMGDFLLSKEHQETLRYLAGAFRDAKEYGSLLQLEPRDYAGFIRTWELTATQTAENLGLIFLYEAFKDTIPEMARVAIALTQKYDVVVTNPPYLGSSRFSPKLDEYVKSNYPNEKSDLCMVMYKRALQGFCRPCGLTAFITTSSWMFLSSFEKLRKYLNQKVSIVNLTDYGTELFDGKVGHNPNVAWITRIAALNYKMTAVRLVDYCYSRRDEKEPEFFEKRNRYIAKQSNFSKIPGSSIAYWVKNIDIFDAPRLGKYIDARIGMVSGDNNRFLRFWYEVGYTEIEFMACTNNDPKRKKWYPLQKGGDFRKWYGNLCYVINWENDGYELKYNNYFGTRVRSHNYNGGQQFKKGITWNSITSGKFHCRYSPEGFTFDAAGPLCEVKSETYLFCILAFLTSRVANYLFSIINPTINFPSGYLESLPFICPECMDDIDSLSKKCVDSSIIDWDDFETSWNFKMHPLVRWSKGLWEGTNVAATLQHCYGYLPKTSGPLETCYLLWQGECNERFQTLKANEEELNRIFIDIYGLQDELTPEVEDKDVTVRKADLGRDIRSLISYAVGCMFGRYSTYKDGLLFAGEPYSLQAFTDKMNERPGTVPESEIQRAYHHEGVVWSEMLYPDEDNIIPICDDDYFEDDITGRFVKWVEVVYGKDTLEANLKFIADALGGKGAPREVIRNYFLNDFYADHLKTYQKRPIYWLFDSGKKNGFKCLIYMHRYKPDTIARIRTDYVHEQQSRYRTALTDLEQRQKNASESERVKLSKQRQKIQEQAEELRIYEEKVHHLADQMISIDLDDGVKHNYDIFKDVLAKIK